MTLTFTVSLCKPHGEQIPIHDPAFVESVAAEILARYANEPKRYPATERGQIVFKDTFGVGERWFVSRNGKTHVAEIIEVTE